MEALMAFFYLGTLVSLQAAAFYHKRALLVVSVLCGALAMASKEVAVTLPIATIWFDRVFLASTWKQLWRDRALYYLALM